MKKVLLAASLVVFLGSCYNDKYDKLYIAPPTTTTVDLCDTATNPAKYSTSVKNVFSTKCATSGCHNTSTKESGYDLSLFATDSSASARVKLRITSTSSPMPPTTSPQLTACEKGQLLNWINKGSHNN